MNRIGYAVGALVALAFCALAQTNDYSNRNVRDPVQLQAKVNNDMAATDSRIDAIEAEVICQRDTNTTTSVTTYTASRAGVLLVGKTGGTGVLWRASAAGTNGWVEVLRGL